MSDRIYFGDIEEILGLPNLIETQTRSYEAFLQKDTSPDDREKRGMEAILREVFPVDSYDEKIKLIYINYEIGVPKMSVLEALRAGETFSAPLYVNFDLTDETSAKRERVYMGEIPLMTDRGTFVINGVERVVISQLHRSPGICFETTRHANGMLLYGFRVIPDRGTWVEVQYDTNGLLYVYLDRRRRTRKFLVSTFLRAIGLSTNKEIAGAFYDLEEFELREDIDEKEFTNKVLVDDLLDGEAIVARAYDPLSKNLINQAIALKHKSLTVIEVSDEDTLVKTLRKDISRSSEEALKDIYRRLRPGDPPTTTNARTLLRRLFFDEKRYDLTRVGRYKLNQKLQLEVDDDVRILQKEDLIAAIKYLVKIRRGEGILDDIDHLGSRRVRTVGELVGNQCRVGLARTARLVKERMTLYDANSDSMIPHKLVNAKALATVIKDFFGRSQLSQFMDQTNPLSEITHKRRLSALGPGGLSRDRAGFEVRDVHPSHYGRICPIETPEGPNIGLINSMSCYSRINDFGFIETPYRMVMGGKVTEEIVYLTADQEEDCMIAQASNAYKKDGSFVKKRVTVRYHGEFVETEPENVKYMDVSTKQLVSVAASLIPFLEHDDANRALMGSNMQRQSVPLLINEAPLVGTGMEEQVVRSSRAVIVAVGEGIVAAVSSEYIVITADGKLPVPETVFLSKPETLHSDPSNGLYVYRMRKFMRSNSGTTINETPLVKRGQKIERGDTIADGPCTDKGELALGKNLLVAFLPWYGYNFEDAITISERVVREDVFTSIHSSVFDIEARDTKLGPEEITRDIPGLGEEALKDLDEDGVVRMGAEVKPGDILVGKITPKSETELAPEERLLRAIFGEKAADVKDTSLRVPTGCSGIVMDVRVTSRSETGKRTVTAADIAKQRQSIVEDHKSKRSQLVDQLAETFATEFNNKKFDHDLISSVTGEVVIPAGEKANKILLHKAAEVYDELDMEKCETQEKVLQITEAYEPRFEEIDSERDEMLDKLESSEENESATIKQVKVYTASKRKLSVGDKMAGRHGNKGVVAKIVPQEDMPFLEDGTPVDICLNPLGVPSRMNVGQVLETHLGIAAKALGFKVATPVFDGISEEKIVSYLKEAKKKDGFSWVDETGKSWLCDGQTGERFNQKVVVGYIYMLKLDHLVADKIHARAVGPYSLVTQQPLGGKAQCGGQRLGEMEVWALEAYGAAYTLQELLTVKSDDVQGRTRIYESIVRGDNTLEAGTPESFNVLIKEMQGLGLNVKLISDDDDTEDQSISIEELIA